MRLSASLASGRHPHTSNTPVALVMLAMCALVAMLVGTFAVPSTVYAQAVTGTLLGNVTDSSGAAVPGATVTATEVQTNIARTAVRPRRAITFFRASRTEPTQSRPSFRGSEKSFVRMSESTSTRRCAWT